MVILITLTLVQIQIWYINKKALPFKDFNPYQNTMFFL